MFANDSDLPITTRMETNSAYPESEAPPVLHPRATSPSSPSQRQVLWGCLYAILSIRMCGKPREEDYVLRTIQRLRASGASGGAGASEAGGSWA